MRITQKLFWRSALGFIGAIVAGIIVTLISSLLLNHINHTEEDHLQKHLTVIKEHSSRLTADIASREQALVGYKENLLAKERALAEASQRKPWYQLGESSEMRILKNEIANLRSYINQQHSYIYQANMQLFQLNEILSYETKLVSKESALAEASHNKPWYQLDEGSEIRNLKVEIAELESRIEAQYLQIEELNKPVPDHGNFDWSGLLFVLGIVFLLFIFFALATGH